MEVIVSQVVNTPATQWKAGDDVLNTIKDLITKYHLDLALCSEEIAVIFKEKSSKVGDAVVSGKTSKASKLFGVLGETDWKFIITLGADTWEELTDAQRVALLDHHLCACGAEENQQTGNIKYFVRLPDVAFYQDEIERHGFWRTSGSPIKPDLIKDLFGE